MSGADAASGGSPPGYTAGEEQQQRFARVHMLGNVLGLHPAGRSDGL